MQMRRKGAGGGGRTVYPWRDVLREVSVDALRLVSLDFFGRGAFLCAPGRVL